MPGCERWWVRMLLVLALAIFLFFARLGDRAFWSEEVRWAEIPREMVLHDDYLHPTINGKTYFDKPLLSYWLVVLAAQFTGSLDEFSVRLPCACFGLLGVGLAMLIGRRLYGEDAGVLSGIILATSFSFVFFSRHASADVETVTGVLAAVWVFLRNEHRPHGWWTLFLWLIMALTSMTKGLLGFVLPVLILHVYAALTPNEGEATPDSAAGWLRTYFCRNRWFYNLKSLLVIPIALLVYLAPFLFSEEGTNGLEMVYRENIRRFFDPVNHRGPPYLYVYVIFMLMAPWSALLPAALIQAHVENRTDGRHRFAIAYFWATFLFFTLSASRRSYYLLPVLPAGAFLSASLLTRPRDSLHWLAYRLLQSGVMVSTIVVGVSLALVFSVLRALPAPWDGLPKLPHGWVFLLAWHASVIALALALPRLRPAGIARAMTVTAGAMLMYLFLFFLPGAEAFRTQKPFAESVAQKLGPDVQEVALFRNREIVFYLGQAHPLKEYVTAEDLGDAARGQKVRWFISRRRDWYGTFSAHVLVAETVYPWESPTQKDSKLLLLEVDR